jgi:3-mercaptopyruvate sulfurtransferase SseA
MYTQDFDNVPNYGLNLGGTVPLTFNYDANAYTSLTTSIISPQTIRKTIVANQSVIFENPVLVYSNSAGTSSVVYGFYRIPYLTFSGVQVYRDSANTYRYSINDISLLVD